MLNRNLPGILSSPVTRLWWWGKHTSGQTETALLGIVKTGRVLKPISEQNQTSVFSAVLHLPCFIQVLNISKFRHFLYMRTDLLTESCRLSKIFLNSWVLLYFQDIYILLLYMRQDLQETQIQERAIKNSDNSLHADSFYFLFCNDFPSNLLETWMCSCRMTNLPSFHWLNCKRLLLQIMPGEYIMSRGIMSYHKSSCSSIKVWLIHNDSDKTCLFHVVEKQK